MIRKAAISLTSILALAAMPLPVLAVTNIGAPVNPIVSSRLAKELVVTWGAPSDGAVPTDYLLRYSSNRGSSWKLFGDGVSTETSMHVTGLTRGITYQLQVKTVSDQLQSAWVPVLTAPVQVQSISLARMTSTYCASLTDGAIYCWGITNLAENLYDYKFTPGRVADLQNATSVEVGYQHACALLGSGEVACWGDNTFGQLGNLRSARRLNPVVGDVTAALVDGIASAVQISVWDSSSCALLATGTVSCWGKNDYGEVGDGTRNPRYSPFQVPGISNAKAVSVGGGFACALLDDATVKCWGDNSVAQLGDGTKLPRTVPVSVKGLAGASSLSAGGSHACVIRTGGVVACWGSNNYYQIAGDSAQVVTQPRDVKNLDGVAQVSSGGTHTCALTEAGAISCWGDYGNGRYANPTPVASVSDATAISSGDTNACLLDVRHVPFCWGHSCWAEPSHDLDGNPTLNETCFSAKSPQPVAFFQQSINHTLPALPTKVSGLNLSSTGTTSAQADWRNASGDGLPVDNYKFEWSKDGKSWLSKLVTLPAYSLNGLTAATGYNVRVTAHSAAGWGEPSDIRTLYTDGSRSMRFTFNTSNGAALSGGSVEWGLDDDSYGSASSYGVTALGVLDFPRVAAGPGWVSATGLQADGVFVAGKWQLELGKDPYVLSVPQPPVGSAFRVQVKLPNGEPVAGASVSVAGLSETYSAGDFIYSAPSSASGLTGADGSFTATGFATGDAQVSVTYNDGVLRQTKKAAVTSATTVVQLSQMPWLDLVLDSKEADLNALVPVDVSLQSGGLARLARWNQPFEGSSPNLAGVKVSINPPVGANMSKCKGTVMSTSTDAKGKATLMVCAVKSGVFTLAGKGAAATGAFTLKVKGAAPMPVTSAAGVSPQLGVAKLAWNPPAYTGGAPVLKYLVKLSGNGQSKVYTATKPQISIGNLANATTYTASIVAVTKNGNSDPVVIQVPVA